MRFPVSLVRGLLVRRYKRFLADVILDSGDAITAHCANPGSMAGVAAPGSEVWLSKSPNPARKLAYTWELIRVGTNLVGINSMHPNAIVAEALTAGAISEITGYARLRREVKYGKNSRIDILLEDDERPPCYVEIKSVHLARRPPVAEFPDAKTVRGAKHLEELAQVVKAGGRAVMVYVVQRTDCDRFALASDIDPNYAKAYASAREHGVEAVVYACRVTPDEIVVDRALSFT
ncbi:MAG: DNA/RNA nuclease SfsA [Alphaproteobacteria bacterium]|nr:DNA/RNA nuclease SfsA [Alphaproteobacteria bacterium]